MRKLFILFFTVIPLIGCSSGSHIQSPQGAWVMYHMSGVELNKNQLMKGLPVFRFDLSENRFSGHAGCNQMMSGITISGGEIKFGLIMHTEMACPHMEAEDAVLKLLSENTLKYDIKDSVLTLTSSDGTVMQFKKEEGAD